jgi:hypothetical protein
LFYALKNVGIKKMKVMYQQIITTKDSTLYFGGMEELSSLWRKLRREYLYQEAYDAFFFIGKDSENLTLQYYIINSLEQQGKLKEAIVKIDTVLKGKLPANQKEYFIQYQQDVTKELENK